MARSDAQRWYDPLPGDPFVEYISPTDAKSSVAQIYADMAGVVQVGDGANGQLGHLYIPDKNAGEVDPGSFTGENPVGWVDLGPSGNSSEGQFTVFVGPIEPVPDPTAYDIWVVTP